MPEGSGDTPLGTVRLAAPPDSGASTVIYCLGAEARVPLLDGGLVQVAPMDSIAERLGGRPSLALVATSSARAARLCRSARLTALLRTLRPHVLHTHASKAGALGWLADILSGRRGRPGTVLTFPGHMLSGYFSRPLARTFTGIERSPARRGSRLVAVSQEVHDGLARLGIAPASKISLVRISTRVSGVASLVRDRETDLLVETGFARAVGTLLRDWVGAAAWGQAGRRYVVANFSLSRLVSGTDRL